MIIVRSPLRVTLGGGGTDFPSYYSNHEGFLIAGAINKYVYVAVNQPFEYGIFLKYAESEKVERVDDIKHPIIREVLRNYDPRRLEVTTWADIPAGTGLGSSSSFTTALIMAMHTQQRQGLTSEALAQAACDVEINKLGEPIGKQDQYVAAYGGLNSYAFQRSGHVHVSPIGISEETLRDLEENLLLFFTGFNRKASSILADQEVRTRSEDATMVGSLHYTKDLGKASHKALQAGDLKEFAGLMTEQWKHKRMKSVGMTNPQIDEWYRLGLANGALGGKLVGAGGGGFLMFYAEDKARLRKVMKLEEMRFLFDYEGTKVILI